MALDVREWLRVLMAFGCGNYDIWRCIDKERPEDSLEKMLEESAPNNPYVSRYNKISYDETEELLKLCEKNHIDVVTFQNVNYPRLLKYIDNPPAVIFVYGQTDCFNQSTHAAIVGARDCCEYSRKAAFRFANELALRNVGIVSGFARGIDSAAHIGALKADGVTIAVLGCGILCDYPRGTMGFKRDIAKKGAVISELFPNAPVHPFNFKMRNRLISGISSAVIVAEASEKSGSLNTASHAADQGKDVFVIPPRDIFDGRFSGQAGLLRDGASVVCSPDEILDYLSGECYL